MRYLVHTLITAAATLIIIRFFPHISVIGDPLPAALGFAVILGFINTWIRPVLKLLALPATILSLGLAALIINGICFGLAGNLAIHIFKTGIVVDSLLWMVIDSIVISFLTSLLSMGTFKR